MRRTAGIAVLVGLFAAAAWLAWPAGLGGRTTYVTTHGTSMLPRFRTGDLAVVRPAAHYGVGDVVAYRSVALDTVVLHRIVAVEEGRYTLQGDDNSWLDTERPSDDDIIGELALRIPGGGAGLRAATSPRALAALTTLVLLASGGGAGHIRSRRRKRTMVRHAAPPPPTTGALRALSPRLRTAAGATAAIAVAGVALGAFAWTRPVRVAGSAERRVERSMTFSYTAAVHRSPAYDGTTAASPDPVFRRLARTVDVRFAYAGPPGRSTVDAVLSTASGWHTTVPLAPETAWGGRVQTSARLDLDALEARARAAAAATGIPAGDVTITVVPHVAFPDATRFEPALRLVLTPLQLRLADEGQAPRVTDAVTVHTPITAPRMLRLPGRPISVAAARTGSAVLLLAALLAFGALVLVARRSAPAGESAAIRRRYAPLLLAVHPMPLPPGRPLVDVAEFATLVKLAERYGLLVLHWSRSDVTTYLVQDEGTTYRYRTGASASAPDAAEAVPQQA